MMKFRVVDAHYTEKGYREFETAEELFKFMREVGHDVIISETEKWDDEKEVFFDDIPTLIIYDDWME